MAHNETRIALVVETNRLWSLWNVEAPYADLDADMEVAEESIDKAALAHVEMMLDADPNHVFEVGETDIAVQHPLTCRAAGNTLLECPVGQAALSLTEPPAEPGFLYYADFDPETGTLSNWTAKGG